MLATTYLATMARLLLVAVSSPLCSALQSVPFGDDSIYLMPLFLPGDFAVNAVVDDILSRFRDIDFPQASRHQSGRANARQDADEGRIPAPVLEKLNYLIARDVFYLHP